MLKDEINEIINEVNYFDNKNDMLCLICFFQIKNYKEKEYFKIEEVKELLILITILKKNMENIKNKELKKEIREEIIDDLKGYKKDYQKLVKIEKEEILTYIKNINETIELIQKEKELELLKEKNKNDFLENQKKLKETLLDNISL